jgi:hypothetical protein
MCNCGSGRQNLAASIHTTSANRRLNEADSRGPALRRPAAARPSQILLFEYIGDTAMTVFGGATRRRYRFSAPGARVQVDARDGSSLTSIPRLKLVTANAL